MYTYVYIYVCIYMYICILLYICTYTHTHNNKCNDAAFASNVLFQSLLHAMMVPSPSSAVKSHNRARACARTRTLSPSHKFLFKSLLRAMMVSPPSFASWETRARARARALSPSHEFLWRSLLRAMIAFSPFISPPLIYSFFFLWWKIPEYSRGKCARRWENLCKEPLSMGLFWVCFEKSLNAVKKIKKTHAMAVRFLGQKKNPYDDFFLGENPYVCALLGLWRESHCSKEKFARWWWVLTWNRVAENISLKMES